MGQPNLARRDIFVSGDHVARGYLDLQTATLPSSVTRSNLSDMMGFVHRGNGFFIGMPPLREVRLAGRLWTYLRHWRLWFRR